MTRIDDDLAHLGEQRGPSASVRSDARAQLRGRIDAATVDHAGDTAAVVPLRSRRRTIGRVALVGVAAAAVAAVSLSLPDGSGLVGTQPASAAVLLDRAANKVEQATALQWPIRIETTYSYAPGPDGEPNLNVPCVQYLVSEHDTVSDCAADGTATVGGMPASTSPGIAAIAFAESPEASGAAFDRAVARMIADSASYAHPISDEVARVSILTQTLQLPQVAPEIRAALLRRLHEGSGLASSDEGAAGTRFTTNFGDTRLSVTVDDDGFVREFRYADVGSKPRRSDNVTTIGRPAHIDELPANIAAVADSLIEQATAMAGDHHNGTGADDTSLSVACTVTPGDAAAGRSLSGTHCFSPS